MALIMLIYREEQKFNGIPCMCLKINLQIGLYKVSVISSKLKSQVLIFLQGFPRKRLPQKKMVIYKKYMSMHHQKYMSQYDFRCAIPMAWLDPDTYWKRRVPRKQKILPAL